MYGYYVTKSGYVASRFDEITVAPNESVFVHKDFLGRAYVSKSDESEYGFIPISVLENCTDQLDQSFENLNLDLTSLNQDRENVIFADLRPVADPNVQPSNVQPTVEPMPNIQPAVEPMSNVRPSVEPNDSNIEPANDSFENSGPKKGKTKKALPIKSLGDFANSRKRTSKAISIDDEVRAKCTTVIRRFVTSSRSAKGSTATMISQIGDCFFKSSLISVSSKKAIFRCYDCKVKTHCSIPESAVAYVLDPKGRKRCVASNDFRWSTDEVRPIFQEVHDCTGRKEESVDFLYDEMVRHAKLIIKDLQDPSRYTANDILSESLKCIYTSFGRKTVKKTMETDPENARHTRSFNDKINRLLTNRREETNQNHDQIDDSFYAESIFKFDKIFFESTGLKLFFDEEALQFLCDSESQVQLDGTFPSQLTRGKKWIQLLKVKTFKKNNNSLVFYCAMTEKTIKQYEQIFDRVKILCRNRCQKDFAVQIASSDQEAALIAIAKKYFPSAIYKTCSFHYNNNNRKQMISAKLKKVMHRRNLKSSESSDKLIAKGWIIIKSLPFLPKNIAKLMIEYLLHRISKLTINNDLIAFEKIVTKLKADHDDEDKLDYINWWHLITETDSFVDTTTGRLG